MLVFFNLLIGCDAVLELDQLLKRLLPHLDSYGKSQ